MFFLRFIITEKIRLFIVSNSGTGFPSIRGLRGHKARYLRDVSWWANDKDAELLRLGYVKPEVVSWSPRIIVLHNFLSSEECEYLKAIARPRLQVSTVVDIKTGKGVKSDVRTNSGILDRYNTRDDLRKIDHLAIDKYALRGLRSLAVARQTVPEKTKKNALVIHGNSLVGCLCLILHDMIVHTPLEELQTSVSTSVINLLFPVRLDLSSVWDQTCIHTISFSTWIRKPSERV
ncbi:BnaC09g08830D [Brassica napus]|uniref:BnaC09g08830D protein n=1 Tax=Brassica napus TaxID=3708 RepID=A0A078GN32_BRANA|nr:BnaC09g08830D [Brassica napus]